MRRIKLLLLFTVVFGIGVSVGAAVSTQKMMLEDEVYLSPTSGTSLKMLLDSRNLGGGEVEIGEITFPPGTNSGNHPHGSTEVFYVLSGEAEHVVNGESHLLKPGMLGFVRPPDEVNHIVPGDEPVKALVIWAPGGEAQGLMDAWEKQ